MLPEYCWTVFLLCFVVKRLKREKQEISLGTRGSAKPRQLLSRFNLLITALSSGSLDQVYFCTGQLGARAPGCLEDVRTILRFVVNAWQSITAEAFGFTKFFCFVNQCTRSWCKKRILNNPSKNLYFFAWGKPSHDEYISLVFGLLKFLPPGSNLLSEASKYFSNPRQFLL